MSKYKNARFTIILPLVIAVSIVAGIVFAELINTGGLNKSILLPRKKDKLNIVLDYVANEYVDEVDRESLSEIAIPKFLEALDPHSVYFTAEEALAVEEELQGVFDGIGVQFNIYRDTVLVVSVIEGGPSENFGLQSGDRIVKVNDSTIAGIGITNDDVMSLLKGPKNSVVKLDIFRRGQKELISYKIQRGSIPLKSVDGYYMINDEIGYLKISTFSSNTYNQFIDAIFNMKKQGLKSIIIDLRNNSGGYLSSATDIVDEFFESGYTIVYTEGRARPKSIIGSTKKRSACIDLDVVVLIDEYSASASEIVAGAIQDNDRGFVIGRRSYGKGLVQESTTFDDGSIIRMTTARYYTPSGRCIQKSYDNGLDEYYSDIYNRYAHGEFLQEDSIQKIDSLIFYTNMGRPVYGGGGIMPDVFVPIDTAGYSELYANVSRNNLEYYFAIDYVDSHRTNLNKVSNSQELKDYLSDNNTIDQFWQYVAYKGVVIRPMDKDISGKYIENNVHAYIARQVLGDNGFYEVTNEYDVVMDSAINVIRSERKLIK